MEQKAKAQAMATALATIGKFIIRKKVRSPRAFCAQRHMGKVLLCLVQPQSQHGASRPGLSVFCSVNTSGAKLQHL